MIRGDPRALTFTKNLFDLFPDEAINWDAASSIGKIAAITDVLTKTNYVVTKVCMRLPCWACECTLIALDYPVPRSSEVYERAVTTVDEEFARVFR